MLFVLVLALSLTVISAIEIFRSYQRIKVAKTLLAVKPLLGVVAPKEDSYGLIPTETKKKVK
jgi:hypothetical protein